MFCCTRLRWPHHTEVLIILDGSSAVSASHFSFYFSSPTFLTLYSQTSCNRKLTLFPAFLGLKQNGPKCGKLSWQQRGFVYSNLFLGGWRFFPWRFTFESLSAISWPGAKCQFSQKLWVENVQEKLARVTGPWRFTLEKIDQPAFDKVVDNDTVTHIFEILFTIVCT